MAKATEPDRIDAVPATPAADAIVYVPRPVLGLSRLSLSQKLWAAIALFLGLWLGHLSVASLSGQDVQDMTAAIDSAGRLRMLSQRVVLDAQWPGLSAERREARVGATLAAADDELVTVNQMAFRLTASDHRPGIRAELSELRESWTILGQAARHAAANPASDATALLDTAETTLTRAEGLVRTIQTAQSSRHAVLTAYRNALYMIGAVLLAIIAFSIHQGGVRPLRALTRLAEDIHNGQRRVRVDYDSRDEIGQLARTLNHASERISGLLRSLAAERDAAAEERRRETLLFESAADGLLIVDNRLTVVRANREAERIFGYPHGALIGRDIGDLVPEAQRDGHDAMAQAYFQHARVRAMRSDMRIRGLRADGTTVPVDIRLGPIELGAQQHAIAAVRDVSVQREAESVRDRLAGILEVTSDLVLIFRTDGHLTYANPAAVSVLGIDPLQHDGRRIDELLTPASRNQLNEAAIPHLAQAERWHGTLSFASQNNDDGIPVSCVMVCQRDDLGGIETFSLIARDISAEIRHRRELEHQATHDALTGLPNRTVFDDRLRQELRHAEREQTTCGVAFVDVDNFKLINDSMGHAAGDKLLTTLAQRLQGAGRGTDTVVRFGGDEFALILPDVRDAEAAGRVAERLVRHVARPVGIDGHSVALTVSVGVALYPDHATDAESLTMRADAAMFEAKGRGRNRFALFHPDTATDEALTDLSLRSRLPG